MKKAVFIFILLFSSTCLFALSERYEKILRAANAAEEKQNYVYALNYYYEAMEENPYLCKEAYDAFNSLSQKVRSGNPTGEDLDPFDMNDLWCNIINSYNQYYIKNNPYIYMFEDIQCSSLDYIKKTSNWSINYKVELSPRFEIIYDCLQEGFENTKHKEWNNIDENWLNSPDVIKELNFNIDILDKDGKVLASSVTEGKTAFFNDVNRANTKILNGNKIKLNVQNPDGRNAVIQSPYKKSKKRTEVIRFYETLITELVDVDVTADEDLYPYYCLSDFVYTDMFDYVMDEYYSWLEKNSKSEIIDNKINQIIFCNLLSQKFNLKSCYTVKGSSNVYNWGINSVDPAEIECNYEASGFRIPTELENSIYPVKANSSISNNSKEFRVVRSELTKRRSLKAERREKAELELKKQKELEREQAILRQNELDEEQSRLDAEQEQLAAEQARLDAEIEAKQRAAELRKAKRLVLQKKIKRVADKSIRDTVILRGSLDDVANGINPGISLYGSAGYHFLFGYASVDFANVDKFVENSFPFDKLNAESFTYMLGGGVAIPITDEFKVYASIGTNAFENISKNQFVRYGAGIDFVPFTKGLLLNFEADVDYFEQKDIMLYKLNLGLGFEF